MRVAEQRKAIAWLQSPWPFAAVLAICIARLWLQPLPSSFWVDELITRFIVQHPHDPALAIVPQLTASPYYAIPRAFVGVLGESETVYRIPSVLLMAISLFAVSRIAARLIHPKAAWFAVFACLAFETFDYYAAEARPYPLGICVVCLAIYFLIRWMDTAALTTAILFLLMAAFLWWIHLVYWPVYPIFVFYAIWRLARGTTKVTWLAASAIFVVLGVCLLPVAVYSMRVLAEAKTHNFAPMPSLRVVPLLLNAPVVATIFVAALLPAYFCRWRLKPTCRESILLPAVWWLWIPLCLFVYSRATGNVLMVNRYISPILPGAALTATAAVGFFLPERYWRHAALALGLGVLAILGHWNYLALDHTPEHWRQAAANADFAAEEPDTPVLMVSPYIEGQPPIWNPNYKLPGFLYAPIDFYPLRGKVYPLPFLRSREADDFAVSLVRGILSHRARFIVYGAGWNCVEWMRFLGVLPELKGWRISQRGAGAVIVAVFYNPAMVFQQ